MHLEVGCGDYSSRLLVGSVLDMLKQWSADPQCLAFDTNGIVKCVLVKEEQWNTWASDLNKGLYIRVLLSTVLTTAPSLAPTTTTPPSDTLSVTPSIEPTNAPSNQPTTAPSTTQAGSPSNDLADFTYS